MTDPTDGAVEDSLKQQTFDLYKLRVEVFERNFLSLRTVEWQVAFQIYVAYASIVTGFFSLKGFSGFGIGAVGLAVGAVLLMLVVLVVGTFWQVQILSRLHHCRGMQDLYLDALHVAVAPELSVPAHLVMPRFAGWWAFAPMQALHVATFIAVLVVVLNSTSLC